MNDDRTDEIMQDEDVEGHRLYEGNDRLATNSDRLATGSDRVFERSNDDDDVEGHRLA